MEELRVVPSNAGLSIGKKIAFYLIIILLFLVALEVVLRTTHLFGAPAILGEWPIFSESRLIRKKTWND